MSVLDWLRQSPMISGFDALAVGVAVHERDGTLAHVNRAATELFGWTRIAPVALADLVALLHLENAAGAPASVEDHPVALALVGRESRDDVPFSLRLADGLRRHVRLAARGLRSASGELMGAMQTIIDDPSGAHPRGHTPVVSEAVIPVLTVGNRLLLQPLMGTLDADRAVRAMEKLLDTIGATGSKMAIVDITGVSAVDTATANHLLRSLAAARLLGCEVVLSGVSPPIARTITLLGLDLSAIRTKRDVAAAIEFGRRWVEATEHLPARDAATLLDPGSTIGPNGRESLPVSPDRPTGASH